MTMKSQPSSREMSPAQPGRACCPRPGDRREALDRVIAGFFMSAGRRRVSRSCRSAACKAVGLGAAPTSSRPRDRGPAGSRVTTLWPSADCTTGQTMRAETSVGRPGRRGRQPDGLLDSSAHEAARRCWQASANASTGVKRKAPVHRKRDAGCIAVPLFFLILDAARSMDRVRPVFERVFSKYIPTEAQRPFRPIGWAVSERRTHIVAYGRATPCGRRSVLLCGLAVQRHAHTLP